MFVLLTGLHRQLQGPQETLFPSPMTMMMMMMMILVVVGDGGGGVDGREPVDASMQFSILLPVGIL